MEFEFTAPLAGTTVFKSAAFKNKMIYLDMLAVFHILVADDIKINLMLITKILEKDGCKVFSDTHPE